MMLVDDKFHWTKYVALLGFTAWLSLTVWWLSNICHWHLDVTKYHVP